MADNDKNNNAGEDKNNLDNNKNQIDLIFVVGGASVTIPNVNIHKRLSDPAKDALDKTGNLPASPLEKWMVLYNDNGIDVNATIKDLKLPDRAEIYMNKDESQGG